MVIYRGLGISLPSAMEREKPLMDLSGSGTRDSERRTFMARCCANCQWCSDDMICENDDSWMYKTSAGNCCPFWENYDADMWEEDE